MTQPRAAEFYERNVISAFTPENIVPFINGRMLFNKHLGFNTAIETLRAKNDPKFIKTERQFTDALTSALLGGVLSPQCALQYFTADAEGDTLNLYDPQSGKLLAEFTMPRLAGTPACLADLVPQKNTGDKADVALFACTAGTRYAAQARKYTDEGEFVNSHLLNIAAITCAEAMAEAAQHIASDSFRSGFLDFSTVMALTSAASPVISGLPPKAKGGRYSFGYPLCPDLSYQQKLFALLDPRDIGITLTELFMMEPEASVSGLIFPAGPAPADD